MTVHSACIFWEKSAKILMILIGYVIDYLLSNEMPGKKLMIDMRCCSFISVRNGIRFCCAKCYTTYAICGVISNETLWDWSVRHRCATIVLLSRASCRKVAATIACPCSFADRLVYIDK